MEEKIKMTKDEYKKYVESKAKKSNIYKNVIIAFIIGGIICLIGEGIKDIYIYLGFEKKLSGNLSTITLIFIGALLTALNLYSKLGKIAGAGSIVPITGFSNSIVAPAIEHKVEGYILGVGSKMFKIAGPVLVYGILTSSIIGLIYYVIGKVM